MIDVMEILKELTAICAVSGHENLICGSLKKYFEKYCDSVEIDRYFNVIGRINGSSSAPHTLMVTAHADEIGFLVSGFEDKGFIKISNVGGIDARVMLAQEVIIYGKTPLTGIIGAKPPHLLTDEEKKKTVKVKELSVDTGLPDDELKKLVSIGDMVTLRPRFQVLQNGRINSKALDNRSSLAALISSMEALSLNRPQNNVIFVATVQEEFELAGAVTAAYNLNPELAVVVDTCHGDMPGVSREDGYNLGKGPAIGVGPILSRRFTELLIKTAADLKIPYQIDVESDDTGTEAWATQVSRCGIPTLLISIPVRYMHTPVETAQISDIADTSRLISGFIGLSAEMGGLFCC